MVELQIGTNTVRSNVAFRDLIGGDVADLAEVRSHVVDTDHLDQLVTEVFIDVANGGAADAHLELRHSDGTEFPVRVRVQMVAAREHDDGFLVITVEDLTSFFEKDRDHRRMMDIVEATAELVGFCDIRSGDFIYMNESARELLGWHGVDTVPAKAIFTETTQPTFEDEIVPAIRRHEPWRGDIEVHTPMGPRILDCSILRTTERGDSVVAAEFTSTSISSGWPPPLSAPVTENLTHNPQVRFYEPTRRGYALHEVRRSSWTTRSASSCSVGSRACRASTGSVRSTASGCR